MGCYDFTLNCILVSVLIVSLYILFSADVQNTWATFTNRDTYNIQTQIYTLESQLRNVNFQIKEMENLKKEKNKITTQIEALKKKIKQAEETPNKGSKVWGDGSELGTHSWGTDQDRRHDSGWGTDNPLVTSESGAGNDILKAMKRRANKRYDVVEPGLLGNDPHQGEYGYDPDTRPMNIYGGGQTESRSLGHPDEIRRRLQARGDGRYDPWNHEYSYEGRPNGFTDGSGAEDNYYNYVSNLVHTVGKKVYNPKDPTEPNRYQWALPRATFDGKPNEYNWQNLSKDKISDCDYHDENASYKRQKYGFDVGKQTGPINNFEVDPNLYEEYADTIQNGSTKKQKAGFGCKARYEDPSMIPLLPIEGSE